MPAMKHFREAKAAFAAAAADLGMKFEGIERNKRGHPVGIIRHHGRTHRVTFACSPRVSGNTASQIQRDLRRLARQTEGAAE